MPEYDHLSDADLVEHYKDGDKLALNVLVQRWHKKLCYKAFWIVKDQDMAKDIAQDGWNVIMNKIHTLKTSQNFGAWAARIVCNKALDIVRLKSKYPMRSQELLKEIPEAEPEDNDRTQLKNELLKAIKSLSTEHQEVLRLFYVEAYSLKEISKQLGISTGTVKSRLFHSREKLKTLLKHKHYEN
ncbi:sigma-70 family RNA polymerase sigma factor [Winogradskyella sp. 3972H.M.0a.05]|uniref:RNA polymerase sigma factor n=1 Tax=Winogradskyella sp. 3972H.M.0a.05 TaxID=2950277 RepID=UPI0033946154